ncbi:hypothetical protein [Ahniella affigens]|uniref:hypothetical protein n=1 Tax=Ahniella affigens TaxID=2021234 RepID=UPI0011B29FF6|nr:hypothetical protein [Ahniella affigens]
MYRALFAILICLSLDAHAESVLLGKKLIDKGDGADKVLSAGGKPDRKDLIPADEYSPAIEVWTYRQRDTELRVWLVDEKVVQIQIPDTEPPVDDVGALAGGSASGEQINEP